MGDFHRFVKRVSDAVAPGVDVSPDGRWTALFTHDVPPTLEELSAPFRWIAGFAVNPANRGPYFATPARHVCLVDNDTETIHPIDLPAQGHVYSCGFSPDSDRLALALCTPDAINLVHLECDRRRVTRWPDLWLNGCWLPLDSLPAAWAHRGHLMACRIRTPTPPPRQWCPPLRAPLVYDSRGHDGWIYPIDHSVRGSLRLSDGRELHELLSSQIVVVDAETGGRRVVGDPDLFFAATLSPNGDYLLVQRLIPPFPPDTLLTACGRAIEVWNAHTGAVLWRSEAAAATSEIGARVNRHGWQWDPFDAATVVWIERRPGEPDRIMSIEPPFAEHQQVYSNARPCYKFSFTTEGNLIVWTHNAAGTLRLDYLPATAEREVSLADDVPVVASWNRRSQTVATLAVGVVATSRSRHALAVEHEGRLYLQRQELIERSWRSSLHEIDSSTGTRRDLWRSAPGRFEIAITVTNRERPVVLVQSEAPGEPPRFGFVQDGCVSSRVYFPERTSLPREYQAEGQQVEYLSSTGVPLLAMHYRCAGGDLDPRRPCLVWIHPNVGRGVDVDYVSTRYRYQLFDNFAPVAPLEFLAHGYTVVPFPPLPVMDREGALLDTMVEQVEAGAYALVAALVAQGLVTRDRIVVAGHGLGGWTVAMLLAHTDLFAAGVACSGAYTATSMLIAPGRPIYSALWRRAELLGPLSPLSWPERIRRPLLLVHGEREGPAPVDSAKESRELYAAIRAAGGTVRSVALPYEEHAYVSVDSKWRVVQEMAAWYSAHLSAEVG